MHRRKHVRAGVGIAAHGEERRLDVGVVLGAAPLTHEGGIGGDDRGGQFVQCVDVTEDHVGVAEQVHVATTCRVDIVLVRPQLGYTGANPVGMVEEAVALDESDAWGPAGQLSQESHPAVHRSVVDDDDAVHEPERRLLGQSQEQQLQEPGRREVDDDDGEAHGAVKGFDPAR